MIEFLTNSSLIVLYKVPLTQPRQQPRCQDSPLPVPTELRLGERTWERGCS